jgi:hypothetical protein
MDDLTGRRTALGDELLVLARRHPRETWTTHANLGETARFWLRRHALFRNLDEIIRGGAEATLDQRTEAAQFKPWLARHLRSYLWQLEEHHHVEDHHYFPVFRRVEPRLSAGFELLERDHDALHTAVGGIVERANVVLAHQDPDGAAFRSDLARFREAHVDLGRELSRHLDDEEDLVIPLILEHGERSLICGS